MRRVHGPPWKIDRRAGRDPGWPSLREMPAAPWPCTTSAMGDVVRTADAVEMILNVADHEIDLVEVVWDRRPFSLPCSPILRPSVGGGVCSSGCDAKAAPSAENAPHKMRRRCMATPILACVLRGGGFRRTCHLCLIAASSLRSVTSDSHSRVSYPIQPEDLVIGAGDQ
jgi:hypothetical protein